MKDRESGESTSTKHSWSSKKGYEGPKSNKKTGKVPTLPKKSVDNVKDFSKSKKDRESGVSNSKKHSWSSKKGYKSPKSSKSGKGSSAPTITSAPTVSETPTVHHLSSRYRSQSIKCRSIH